MPPAAQALPAPAPLAPLPEELLARAHWFGDVVRALAEDTGTGARADARSGRGAFAGNVLVELRLQSRLLAAIQDLSAPARDALVEHYIRRPERSRWFGRRRARRAPVVDAALDELRSLLDRDAGGRAGWVGELPGWALLEPAPDETATPLLADRASRVLVALVLIVVAGFLVWITQPTRAMSGESRRVAPMMVMTPIDAPHCSVEGRLSMDGLAFGGWTFIFAPRGHESAVITGGVIADDGTFRLETSAQGEFTLVARDLPGECASHRLELPVVLAPGELRIDLVLPATRRTGAPPSDRDEDLLHVWTDAAGRAFTTRIHAEKRARLGEIVLPAGTAAWRWLPKAAPWPDSLGDLAGLAVAELGPEPHD